MYPILYQTDSIIIDSYSVFFLLAWIVGGVIFYREFRRMDWELEEILFVMAGCIIGAVFGSYLFNVFFAGALGGGYFGRKMGGNYLKADPEILVDMIMWTVVEKKEYIQTNLIY